MQDETLLMALEFTGIEPIPVLSQVVIGACACANDVTSAAAQAMRPMPQARMRGHPRDKRRGKVTFDIISSFRAARANNWRSYDQRSCAGSGRKI